ncbi:MAG: hypothetical protein H0U35_05105 [Sporichthyaceae bacterium]|nr:hypothetical protein [Sporichthyaceae bacterium]
MRMMMKVQMDTAATSRAIQEGRLPEVMQSIMAVLKPEAAYFGPDSGVRTAFIVFDMTDPAQLPSISEPLFGEFNARIEIFPVMDQDDLQRGLSEVAGSR